MEVVFRREQIEWTSGTANFPSAFRSEKDGGKYERYLYRMVISLRTFPDSRQRSQSIYNLSETFAFTISERLLTLKNAVDEAERGQDGDVLRGDINLAS